MTDEDSQCGWTSSPRVSSRRWQTHSRWPWAATTASSNRIHLFSALLDQQGGSTRPLLAQAGVNVPVLRERLTEALDALPKVSGRPATSRWATIWGAC